MQVSQRQLAQLFWLAHLQTLCNFGGLSVLTFNQVGVIAVGDPQKFADLGQGVRISQRRQSGRFLNHLLSTQ